jgi:hypothetical protein
LLQHLPPSNSAIFSQAGKHQADKCKFIGFFNDKYGYSRRIHCLSSYLKYSEFSHPVASRHLFILKENFHSAAPSGCERSQTA